MLAKLATVCYVTYEGKGKVAFDVTDGFIMRENHPPFAPLIALEISVGRTSETRETNGKCPPGPKPAPSSFWSDRFLNGKVRTPRGTPWSWTGGITSRALVCSRNVRSSRIAFAAVTPRCFRGLVPYRWRCAARRRR
jgi:hypothetical protein